MPFRRTIAFLVFIDVYLVTMLISGCQKLDTQPPPSPPPVTAQIATDPTPECAAGRGEQCTGGCNQWDSAAAAVQKQPIPTDAEWVRFAVTGMHCGGCERRIIANVGKLPGVVGVEADAERGLVKVALERGAARAATDAEQKIAALGFGVNKQQ